MEGEVGTQIDSLDVFGMRLSGLSHFHGTRRQGGYFLQSAGKFNGGILHLRPG